MVSGVIYYDPRYGAVPAGRGGDPDCERHRHSALLLNSASSRFPYGLANSTGLVRKNLMLHPWPQVFGYVDEEVDGDRGPQTVMWTQEASLLR